MPDQMIVLAADLGFPEGPVALDDGSVLFVEIAAGRLSRWRPDGKVEIVANTGGGPNGAAIGPDGCCYVCNNGGLLWSSDPNGGRFPAGRAPDYDGGRIERVDLRSGRAERLYDRTDRGLLSGPNDIVFDSHGGFWFTDLGLPGEHHIDRGRICYARADGSRISDLGLSMLTPNGIGLSPDEKILYVAETLTARVWAFEIVEPGRLKLQPWPAMTPGTMLHGADVYCMFNSLAVEAGGNICVATIGAPGIAGITVLSPDRGMIERVATPDRSTTNIAFGGAAEKTAYVTLSRSGMLVAIPWARPGLPLNFLGSSVHR